MYRDEMVKIFAHGFQNGYKGKGPVLHGHNVVFCSSCIPAVKEKNSQATIMAIAFGVVCFLIFIFIVIAQKG